MRGSWNKPKKNQTLWNNRINYYRAKYLVVLDFLGHNAISLNAILANRVNDIYSQNPQDVIESLILFVLNKI